MKRFQRLPPHFRPCSHGNGTADIGRQPERKMLDTKPEVEITYQWKEMAKRFKRVRLCPHNHIFDHVSRRWLLALSLVNSCFIHNLAKTKNQPLLVEWRHGERPFLRYKFHAQKLRCHRRQVIFLTSRRQSLSSPKSTCKSLLSHICYKSVTFGYVTDSGDY